MTHRILLSLAFLIFSLSAFGQQHQKVQVTFTGGAPLPIAYDEEDDASLLISNLQGQSSVVIINTACNLFLDVSTGNATTPPAGTTNELYVPANTSIVLDDIFLGGAVYARSATGGTCTSGTLSMFFYGKRI